MHVRQSELQDQEDSEGWYRQRRSATPGSMTAASFAIEPTQRVAASGLGRNSSGPSCSYTPNFALKLSEKSHERANLLAIRRLIAT
jgi:hypothetical protein